MSAGPGFSIVVPSTGRPSLGRLLAAVAAGAGPAPECVVVVDDRREATPPPTLGAGEGLKIDLVPGPLRGPGAARNAGLRAASGEWVVFLDDDVVPAPGWARDLAFDLAAAEPSVAGVQGRIEVPLPSDRRLTDWERNVAGLATARWATADMAYRKSVLDALGGFDERFPRAYREDADLALRVLDAGGRLKVGRRTTLHPVRPADPWVSVRLQAGNADDVLMRALHGRDWRACAGAPAGRFGRHLGIVAGGAAGLLGLVARRPRWAALGATACLGGSADLAFARIAPGPHTRGEVATMLATSALLPWAAIFYRLVGLMRLPRLLAAHAPDRQPSTLGAVIFDRDGTLIEDIPYNGDPEKVRLRPGARVALERLRAARVPTAVVSNQSGVARGLITEGEVRAVNRRVEELLGPLGPWLVCLHGPGDGCDCRKPAPGLVLTAARSLGVDPSSCALIGDIGSDVDAARAAGARAVLVPTAVTRDEEISAAPEVAADLPAAVDMLLGAGR
ncbi:HAD-IIIA family hydrolase [soil metagenome]